VKCISRAPRPPRSACPDRARQGARRPEPGNADTALRFGTWLGNGPELWLNLQQAYDLWLRTPARGWRALGRIKPMLSNVIYPLDQCPLAVDETFDERTRVVKAPAICQMATFIASSVFVRSSPVTDWPYPGTDTCCSAETLAARFCSSAPLLIPPRRWNAAAIRFRHHPYRAMYGQRETARASRHSKSCVLAEPPHSTHWISDQCIARISPESQAAIVNNYQGNALCSSSAAADGRLPSPSGRPRIQQQSR